MSPQADAAQEPNPSTPDGMQALIQKYNVDPNSISPENNPADTSQTGPAGPLTNLMRGVGSASVGEKMLGEPQSSIAPDLALLNSLEPAPGTSYLSGALYGLGSIGTTAVEGGLVGGPPGAAALTAAVTREERAQQLMAQGVDRDTAYRTSGLEGMATGALSIMPASPIGAVSDSAAINVGAKMIGGAAAQRIIGASTAYSASKVLDDAGYHDMAKQYRQMDDDNAMSEYIQGAFFGGASHVHDMFIKPSDINQAMAVSNNHDLETNSPFGVPATPAARDAHIKSMIEAQRAVMGDEPFDVSGNFTGDKGDIAFAAKPQDLQVHKDYAAAMRKAGFENEASEYEQAIGLSEKNQGRQDNLYSAMQEHSYASRDLMNLQNDQNTLTNEIGRPLKMSELVSMTDPATGARLKSIEDELNTQITATRRADLQHEQRMVMESLDSDDLAGIKKGVAERKEALEKERDTVTGNIEAKQGDVDKYTKNIERLTKKLTNAENKRQAEIEQRRGEKTATAPAEAAQVGAPAGEHPGPVDEILRSNPDMLITKEGGGTIRADEAIKEAANTEPLQTRKNILQALINCFMRTEL